MEEQDALRGGVSSAFRSVMDTAVVPVLVKNGDGYYIFANRAAEVLLGFDAGEIYGLHLTDLVANDPAWLQGELERFKTQSCWAGYLVFRHRQGAQIHAAVNGFVSRFGGGDNVYTTLTHPVASDYRPAPRAQPPYQRYDLSAADIRLIQLLAEGFTDHDMSSILGRSEWAVTREVSIVLQKMRVGSRTEACMRAIKASLIF